MHSGNANRAVISWLFSGYNRSVDGFTQHILVCDAHAQSDLSLAGWIFWSARAATWPCCLRTPAPIFSPATNLLTRPHSFIGLMLFQSLRAEGINTQPIF